MGLDPVGLEHRLTALETAAAAAAAALELARVETERRLGNLNNEHARTDAAVHANVSSEAFSALLARVAILETWSAKADGRRNVTTGLVSLAVSAVVGLVGFLFHH